MPRSLPLEQLGTTARERSLLGRLGVVLAALVIGGGTGISVYAWAATRIGAVDTKIETHLAEMRAARPLMDAYVLEERAARCSMARNLYALCRSSRIACEPVEARCER